MNTFDENNVYEIATTVRRLTYLFSRDTNVTNFENIHRVWYYSVITEILIHLKDLIAKLKNAKSNISIFEQDFNSKERIDVAKLIAHCRDAACHNTSPNRRNYNTNLFAGNIFAGDDFEDEITLIMGDVKIFVKRHLLRAYKEVVYRLSTFPEIQENNIFKESVELARVLDILD